MKRIKPASLILAAAAMIAFTACDRNAGKADGDSGILPQGITMMTIDSASLTSFRDNA